ncbi:MAG: hypothetical protein ACLFVU_00415, partial [Phycisphaerae bacterium]
IAARLGDIHFALYQTGSGRQALQRAVRAWKEGLRLQPGQKRLQDMIDKYAARSAQPSTTSAPQPDSQPD